MLTDEFLKQFNTCKMLRALVAAIEEVCDEKTQDDIGKVFLGLLG